MKYFLLRLIVIWILVGSFYLNAFLLYKINPNDSYSNYFKNLLLILLGPFTALLFLLKKK